MPDATPAAPVTSDWLLVDQATIDRFAEATGDHQFIHVDPVRAAATPLGGTIAHGLLILSLLPALAARTQTPEANVRMVLNYGYDRVRFLSPVRSGKRIRAAFSTLRVEESRPGQWRKVTAVTVEIEGESKPALALESITLAFKDAATSGTAG